MYYLETPCHVCMRITALFEFVNEVNYFTFVRSAIYTKFNQDSFYLFKHGSPWAPLKLLINCLHNIINY